MADLLESMNRVRYAGLDFNTHVDELLSRVQTKFVQDFNDFAASSLGIMLIDLVAFGLDTLSFYLDRRATDTFLETARTRRSVARLTRQLGYKMRSAIASSVTVQMSILDSFAVPVTIPAGFQFKGPNSLIFEAAQQVVYNIGEVNVIKDIPCYQGETFTETFVSDGTPNQVFELRRVQEDRYVVGGSVKVTVNGTPWTEQEFLSFDQTDHYEVGYNDDPPAIRFGDNIAGNIPTATASIVVTYVVSSGRDGLVSRDSIQSTQSPLVVLFQTLRTSVNNSEGSVGGDNPETLDEAKRNAPRVFKTRLVAVTREDYESLGNSYADPLAGRVAVAQAIAARSADDDLFLKDRITEINTQFELLPGLVSAQIGTPSDTIPPATDPIPSSLTLWQRLLYVLRFLTDIQTNTTTASTTLATADTALTNALNNGRTVRNNGQEIQTNSVDAMTRATTIQGTITAIPVASPDQLTSGTKATLLDNANRLIALVTSIQANALNVVTEQNNETTQINASKTSIATVGPAPIPATSYLGLLDAARALAQTTMGVASPTPTAAFAQVKAVYDLICDPTAAANRLTIVRDNLQEIFDHVDRFLAADCKANLVTVPILARDKGGFYVSPSVSLIQSLQNYLDARKEVTQTVEVVSGANFLILPQIIVRVAVRSGYSLEVTQAAVVVVLDNLLRGRRFGQSLYVSDISEAILTLGGVAFVNPTITGRRLPTTTTVSPDKLDGEGNLIILSSEIITKDTDPPSGYTPITVNVEAYTAIT